MTSTMDYARRAAAVLAVAALGLPVLPASAAGRVTLSVQTADPDYATAVDLRGTGFQSVPNAHGGIYVLFGWVTDPSGWQPSKGGAAGATYRYVQDSEAKDNNGFQRFVAFPGSDTASSANGGTVAADGTWGARLIIPGARFAAVDRAGNTTQVDCTKVQCGVITIGAHGVVNPNNETFTPVRFAVPTKAAPPPATSAAAPPPAPAATSAAAPPPPAAPVAAAVISAVRNDVSAGTPVDVSGSGFAANESVQVVLRSGPVFLPPATADASGAFRYAATIPADVPAGQHRLEFTGTQSGVKGEVALTVGAAAQNVARIAEAATPDEGRNWGLLGGIAAAAVVLVVVVTVTVVRKRRRRTEAQL